MRVAVVSAALLVLGANGAATAIRDSSPGLVYSVAVDRWGDKEQIWSADADGANAVPLVLGSEPQLSPDGRWIAFTRRTSLLVIPSTDGPVRKLYAVVGKRAAVYNSGWSPDSKQLVAYSRDARGTSLELVDVATGRQTEFARGDVNWPTVSPDSGKVAYVKDQKLYVYDIARRRTAQITHDGVTFAPIWGPFWIAYTRPELHGKNDVWLIHGGGGGDHQLTHTGEGIYPAAWSADGTRLLGANPAMHNGRLWAIDVASGAATDITGWVGQLVPQGLSRDGMTVYAAIGCIASPGPYGILETLPFAGGKPTVIAGGPQGPCRGSWIN